ncbi:hypothetical protein EYW49_19490 [Siculibacillus lacustris]|uniref:Uncharacterized protein n=1 Tax=Siculibacillus lacustris TaxID=1549641 RepID=A0A4Q9VG56_9HYPH|nr:hypothetical protein [Siculibacillus lacustris]TBW33785.1 hypothetical protein EYW49_19490 [Siculibacillus lacustris]
MKRPLLLAVALLAGAASIGVAFAATDVLHHRHGAEHRDSVAASDDDGAFRVADRERHGHHDRDGRHRRHHDDEGHGARDGARAERPAATDPAAPVPDNRLFQGKARPTVEVN